ncbi:MAG: squalene/phytoene synthase family protein, partial [Bacteroidota bacterium]
TLPLSDAICTALQLTNFWQDISVDTGRNRFYIPREDLQKFGVRLDDLHSGTNSDAFRALMRMQIERTRQLFLNGKPLFLLVAKEFRMELKLIWHGGMRILEKIEALNFDTRTVRPALTAVDSIIILYRAVRG